MKKNSFLSFAVLLFAAAAMITSCSSDEVNNAGPPDKQKKTETVAELTARLKDYGDRLGRSSAVSLQNRANKNNNNKLTKDDWAKIAIADAKGALRGGGLLFVERIGLLTFVTLDLPISMDFAVLDIETQVKQLK